MSRQAHVQSVDAIRQFRAVLCRYVEAVQDVFHELQGGVQRASDWVEHDRAAFWPHEVRRASDALAEALTQLERKSLSTRGTDRPSCTEEKEAVQAARQALRHAEDRVQSVKRWRQRLRHEADEYRGTLNKLTHLVDSDLPRAVGAIDRILLALERYTEPSSTAPDVSVEGRVVANESVRSEP